MATCVGAIEQGTTSTRFMLFDHDGHELARHQLAHEQILSPQGWVEHDPHEIWEATQDVVETGLGRAGVGADDLLAIGIASQRATTVVWDRRTGEPYHHAIASHGDGIDPLRWILDHVDGVRDDVAAGHAIAGTMDTWLIWWLTGGPDGGLHLTDVTNAGATGLTDPTTLDWAPERLAQLDVPRSMLPVITSSSQVLGTTIADGPFSGEVAIGASLADQQAALVGQICLAPGELQITYGAGASLLLTIGEAVPVSSEEASAVVAYRFGEAPPVHAVSGSPDAADAGAEALCRAIRDTADALAVSAGVELVLARVDGPLAGDDAGMQALADALAVPVSRPVVMETAALGAAYAAGLAVGFWASTDDVVASWHESRRWQPDTTSVRPAAPGLIDWSHD